ncbi:MAG: phosphoribosylglycinamide formyltransferase [Cyanobacteria bacterium P01_A01_bin.135]
MLQPPLNHLDASGWLERHFRQPPLQLGVMASGNGSNFEAIAQAIDERRLNARIAVVIYNNPEAGVATRAAKRQIPAILLNHRDYKRRDHLDSDIVAALKQHSVDWVIMAGWMRRVTETLIQAFPGHILNIHPSLLPSFPGLHAVEQAIAAGVKITGCTIHHVVLAVDSGPIVAQAAVPVYPDDTPEILQQRIHQQEHRLYPHGILLAASQ